MSARAAYMAGSIEYRQFREIIMDGELKCDLFDRIHGKLGRWEDTEAMARECLDALEVAGALIERLTVELDAEKGMRRMAEFAAKRAIS